VKKAGNHNESAEKLDDQAAASVAVVLAFSNSKEHSADLDALRARVHITLVGWA
jgi:hypothetical protein